MLCFAFIKNIAVNSLFGLIFNACYAVVCVPLLSYLWFIILVSSLVI